MSPSPEVTIKQSPRRLEPGMIVLEPAAPAGGREEGDARIWTVSHVSARGVTLIAHYGWSSAEAKLKGTASEIPSDWMVLDHDGLLEALAPRMAEQEGKRRELAADGKLDLNAGLETTVPVLEPGMKPAAAGA
jgi:hypothetical protein